MNDLQALFTASDNVARWRAEKENATARLEMARMKEAIAMLLSRHQPVHELNLDREKLRVLFNYISHQDKSRLQWDVKELLNG